MSLNKKGWKYKNITLVLISFIFAFYLSKNSSVINFLHSLGNLGYPSAILVGILFASTFTIATGAVVLFTLSDYLHPIEIALLAGIGGVLGDLLIFKLVKNSLKNEMVDIYNTYLDGRHISKLFHTKYFNWMLPLIGGIIIASPFPDEIGVSLLSISKMNTLHFILISYIFNSIGIFLVVVSSQIL